MSEARPAIGETSFRLCVVPPALGLGSYNAVLSYDSTTMRATRVDVSGGMNAVNFKVAGKIRIAGASPAGFRAGALATIRFRILTGATSSKIDIELTEANGLTGASLLGNVGTSGHPSEISVATTSRKIGSAAAPHIDSLAPRSGRVDAESVLDIAVYGHGFTPRDNAVLFDGARVTGLASEREGTMIRFMAPTAISPRDGRQTRRVGPGAYEVRVRTASGTSNAVTFTVRRGDR